MTDLSEKAKAHAEAHDKGLHDRAATFTRDCQKCNPPSSDKAKDGKGRHEMRDKLKSDLEAAEKDAEALRDAGHTAQLLLSSLALNRTQSNVAIHLGSLISAHDARIAGKGKA